MFNEPNWIILLILGVLLGSYDKIWKLLKYIYRYFFEKRHIEGNWYGYHWTYRDSIPILVTSEITIKKGIWHPYVVELKQINTTLTYTGWGKIEGNDIVITFKSKEHTENLSARFPYIIASKKRTYGLWLSYDHDRQIASGGIILSKELIPDEQIPNEMKKGMRIEENIPLIRIKN